MLNRVSVMGRLLNDPSPICSPDQEITTSSVTTMTLVVATRQRGNQKHSHVDCIDIIFRAGAAGVVSKHLRKGDKVLVEGRLRSRTHNGKRVTQVVGKKVVFIHLKSHDQE